MENEIRYYLRQILMAMETNEEAEGVEPAREPFKPTYIVTAVKLPTGAIELAVNNSNIDGKIKYILEAYDDDMCLRTNVAIKMENIMVV